MMSFDELLQDGLSLQFSGWDFTTLENRWKINQPSWNYPDIAKAHMTGISVMLDLDTGGGELLSALAPFPPSTWATEIYPPNVPIAKAHLEPLGIHVIDDYSDDAIPLPDSSLDLILNRHGSYSECELFRLLKPGGIFLTEQVGGQNDIHINELLQDTVEFEYSYWTKDFITHRLSDAKFELLTVKEDFPQAEFVDVGILVFYLRIIPWQVRDFSVEKYRQKLYEIHQGILANGPLIVNDHRILAIARKPM